MTRRGTLLKVLRTARRRGKRVVFTNGCFDLLHLGHIRLLEKAKRLGDILLVGLNSDSSVRKLKGPHRPVNPERARAEVLASLKAVDHVLLFSEETPERLIRQIRPDVLVKGGDWEKKEVVGKAFIESYGGKVYLFPLVKRYSTTGLLHAGQKRTQKRKSLRHY
ncbi:MAG: D-glycero-beta-D-manno-heptose 1-phosphate adenylyltransferase [Candidatus Omnitrophica bacterium]|nr:D-glycero-beta-D-manno-heptose 1-phosphate adenylyltransferase [Candidatus Omnitrophota bacterium]